MILEYQGIVFSDQTVWHTLTQLVHMRS